MRAVLISALSVLLIMVSVGSQAADPRLSAAQDNLVKAGALLDAAEAPTANRAFDNHVGKARDLINKALREIDTAKRIADQS